MPDKFKLEMPKNIIKFSNTPKFDQYEINRLLKYSQIECLPCHIGKLAALKNYWIYLHFIDPQEPDDIDQA